MRKPPRQEYLFQKELRFLKSPVEGLFFYAGNKVDAVKMGQCETPCMLDGLLGHNQVIKQLPRLPSNNIMVVIYVVLETALERSNGPHLLNKIKSHAYSQQVEIVDLLEVSQRAKYSEIVFKKLFVEFFHLAACASQKNKVEKFMCQYPVMQAAFLLLFRKLLKIEGIADADNLQLPVPTLWILETVQKLFGLSFRKLSHSAYLVQGKHIIAEDDRSVYKSCENQREFDAFQAIQSPQPLKPSLLKYKKHTRSYTSSFDQVNSHDEKTDKTCSNQKAGETSFSQFPPTQGRIRIPSYFKQEYPQKRNPPPEAKFKPAHYRRHSGQPGPNEPRQAIQVKPILFRKQSSHLLHSPSVTANRTPQKEGLSQNSTEMTKSHTWMHLQGISFSQKKKPTFGKGANV